MAEEKKKDEEGPAGSAGWVWLLGFWLFSWVVTHRFLAQGGWHFLGFLIGLGGVVGLFALMVYRFLAPRDLFFSFIDEGTAVIFVKGGRFYKMRMSWEGYVMRPNGDICRWRPSRLRPQPPRRSWWERRFGGLYFYGLPPITQRYYRRHKWAHVHQDGTVKAHEEEQGFVFLPFDSYFYEIKREVKEKEEKAAEDVNNIAVGVSVVLFMRPYNPRQALFLTQDWVAAIGALVTVVLKEFTAFFRWQDLTAMRAGAGIQELQRSKGKVLTDVSTGQPVAEGADLREIFWQLLERRIRGTESFREVPEGLVAYGILILKSGSTVREIDPPPDWRKLATAEEEARLTGEAAVKKATLEAQAAHEKGKGVAQNLMERTVGAALISLARKYDRTEQDIAQGLRAGQYKEEFDQLIDEDRQREGIDAGTFGEWKYPKGAELNSLLDRALSRFAPGSRPGRKRA